MKYLMRLSISVMMIALLAIPLAGCTGPQGAVGLQVVQGAQGV